MTIFLIWYSLGLLGMLITLIHDLKTKEEMQITVSDIFFAFIGAIFGLVILLGAIENARILRFVIFKRTKPIDLDRLHTIDSGFKKSSEQLSTELCKRVSDTVRQEIEKSKRSGGLLYK